jgi:hypothetical protein
MKSSVVPRGSKFCAETGHDITNAAEISFLTLRYGERGEDRRKKMSIKLITKSSIFWNIKPCSPLKVNRRVLDASFFHTGFLVGLFFGPEDGGDVPPKRSRR